MKNEWSAKWNGSTQPRKQRKFRHNAPMHARHRLMSAALSKELRKQVGRRSLPVRKGDEVMLMSGSGKGSRGAVSRVDMKALKVYVEGMTVKKVNGSEVMRALEPSNLAITKLNTSDRARQKKLQARAEKEAAAKAGKESV